MKASDILALLPVKPCDMPQIATSTEPPTRQSLKTFQESIQDQAMAITTSDPILGFLGLVLKDTVFQTLNAAAASYIPPVDPGSAPTATGTAAVITEATRVFVIDQDKYNTYLQFKIILISMITTNCPEKYLSDLKDPITKFRRCTPIELLNHLWTTFGTITSKDLTNNWSAMNAQWNPPTPIADLFKQLQDGQILAKDGNEDITNSQLLRLCYDNVNATGLFDDALKIWRAKPDDDKTYTAFKALMTIEHDDRMKNQLTSKAAGYSSANQTTFVTDLIHQELQQFVNHMPIFQQDPANDENQNPNVQQAPVLEPTPTNANAAITTDALKDIFKSLMKEHKTNNPSKVKPKAQGKDENDKDITYCHSHGITSNLWHNSTTCSRKKEGHNDTATLNNKLGGNTERCKAWRK
jgi:hypothetical protein